MRLMVKKHFRKTDKKPTKKPTKTDKNRQKPINFFGPSARPTKTDSVKGLSVYNPDYIIDHRRGLRVSISEKILKKFIMVSPESWFQNRQFWQLSLGGSLK